MPKQNALQEFDRINLLLDVYQDILTPHQQQVMADYYRFNLSLQEIAIQKGISRAAVSDTLSHVKKMLVKLEAQLQLQGMVQLLLDIQQHENTPPLLKKKIQRLLLQREGKHKR